MADDIQSERFGESVANESRGSNVLQALPVDGDSPYAPVGTPADVNQQSKKEGCGCWVFGCAGLLVGCLLLMAGIGFGGYWFLTGQVEKYTDTEPNQIPVVEMDEEALTKLQNRIESFSSQVVPAGDDADQIDPTENADAAEVDLDIQNQQPLELVLTAREINGLIHSNEDLRGRAHVVIADGNIQANISIPADQVPGGAGRFFNADAAVEVSMEDGVLIVKVVDAKIKGEPLPEAFMKGLAGENLAKEIYDDPDAAKILNHFDSIEVIDDAIHLRLKQDDPPTPNDSAIPAEAPAISAEEPSTAAEQTPLEAPLPLEP